MASVDLGTRKEVYLKGSLVSNVVGIDVNRGMAMVEDNGAIYTPFSVSGTTLTLGTPLKLRFGTSTSVSNVCRLDDDYGVFIYDSSSSSKVYARVFSMSGLVVTLGTELSAFLFTYGSGADIVNMSDTIFVAAGKYTSTIYDYRIRAGSVNKTTKVITPGTEVTLSTTYTQQVRQALDNFSSTYGIFLASSYRESIVIFSVSGTTITPGSFIDFSSLCGSKITVFPVDVAAVSDTKAVILYYDYNTSTTYWDLRAKLVSRTGTTLSELDDERVKQSALLTNPNNNQQFSASIKKDENGKVMIFFTDLTGGKYLLESFEVDGNKLRKEISNQEFEIITAPAFLANAIGHFPTTDSFIFLYNLSVSGTVKTYLKVGNATYRDFIPRVMVI